MAETAETFTVTALQGDTLDMICQRELGATADVTEQALRLNPGLADIGPILPAGHVVTLPLILTTPAPDKAIIQLWD